MKEKLIAGKSSTAFLGQIHVSISTTKHRSVNCGLNFRSCTACSAATPKPYNTRKPTAIHTKNLWLWSPEKDPLLCDVNLDVPPGTLHMLVGRNAAGKSTLLRVLRNLVLPDAGSLHVRGPISYVSQDPDLLLIARTVGADVAISVGGIGARLKDFRKEVIECLSWVGLDARYLNKTASKLSGGLKQRVVVASALALNPNVLLLDEITSNIDLGNRMALLERVKAVVKKKSLAALWCVDNILVQRPITARQFCSYVFL